MKPKKNSNFTLWSLKSALLRKRREENWHNTKRLLFGKDVTINFYLIPLVALQD